MSLSAAPHELAQVLDQWPELRCLSLDCFDTLLWRDVHKPRDLFHALPDTTIVQRIAAEARARRAVESSGRGNEVSITQIYEQLLPNADRAVINAAVKAELAAEALHCFAFEPIVTLMRDAKARGLKVIVVSDTYFDKAQLRGLITDAAGENVAGLIDEIFCSSHFGRAKAQGLYGEVLRKLKLPPATIVHIGDNENADVNGVTPFGVNAIHFKQFSETAEQRFRLEASIDGLLHPFAPATAAQMLPHRAAVSHIEPQIEDEAERFGATALGPIFRGFDGWLQGEAEELERERGGNVHWLFMMRDGHLPRLLHAQSRPDQPGYDIEISRFTAVAASFCDNAALTRFLETDDGTPGDMLARQLLLSQDEINGLCAGLDPLEARNVILATMKAGKSRKSVIRASRAFADRLVEHVRAKVEPAPGDTLMMIDLGYNGTVQDAIAPLLQEQLGVHVAGRYLLLREMSRPGLDKRGFIGSEHYDPFTLEAMCGNVAVIEQLATSSSGSVIDYEKDGSPIHLANEIVPAQAEVRKRVQRGCLRFQAEAPGASSRVDTTNEAQLWRKGTAIALMRLMFLPMPEELAVIEAFEHDINLGTAQTTGMFDKAHSERALRERGLFYMDASERMYLPAELHGQGMATRLSLLTQRRFGLPLTFADSTDAAIDLPVIFANSHDAITQVIHASGTHDGYFLAAIPVGNAQFSIALHFGALFDWFQLDSLTFYKVDEFLSALPEDRRERWDAVVQLEGIAEAAKGLMQCETTDGFVMVPPPRADITEPMLLACVFRPIVAREPAPANESMHGTTRDAQPVVVR
ncbi:HAD family hydrolase [Qipengyuania sp.]|uniref:HAD family hydrolase n=1 Tax=Qipengyuania sp. TaxID=2004515 RepID=UPI0035C84E97